MEAANWTRSRRLGIDMSWRAVAESIFSDLIVSRTARSFLNSAWRVAPGPLGDLPGGMLLHQRHGYGTDEWIIDFAAPGFALIEHAGQDVKVRVAAQTDAHAKRIMAELRAAIPEGSPPTPAVRVTFWRLGEHEALSVTKDLAAPQWPDIECNYPVATAGAIMPLLAEDWRPQGGRLLLWHGEPGTGKTYAMRALMQAWKAWCSFDVVLDPESFFGSGADYMVNVLLRQGDDDDAASNGHAAPPWRLLILEDTGELLSADAKDRAGQGLSRLLNLCDGLLGQSMNVLVLITTNEDFGRMHPAVVRPGRCLMKVEFGRFGSAEAHRWLVERGLTDGQIEAATLAELYSRLDGHSVPQRQAVAGFLAG